MKSKLPGVLMMSLVMTGCTKSGTETPNIPANSNPPITITVVEDFTNKPVEGAVVNLRRCTQSGSLGGCSQVATVATYQTSSDGTVTLASNGDDLEIKHKDYWTRRGSAFASTTYKLTPKCTIIVHIKKVKTYQPTDFLNVILLDPNCICFQVPEIVGLPVDTTMNLTGRGYMENKIAWYMNYPTTDTGHILPPLYINGSDTGYTTLEY